MLETQKNYLDALENLFDVFEKADISTEKIETLIQFIKKQELLVPVVGEFSAGKSTLLNSFIGNEKNVLPTSVSPETAIATELRFGTDERIEAIGKDGQILKVYGINDFDEINRHASEYSYLKLYLKNINIRNIEPLVLVDMPGFESPLDAHNDAIRKYLNRGVHFIVLISATDGTLRATSMRHLNDILEYDRDFSVVLSKSNLVMSSNLEDVIEKVRDDVDLNFGLEKEPVPIGMDGSKAVGDIVAELNPDELFVKIVRPVMKDTVYQLESNVNMRIAAFNKDTSANDEIIEQLKRSVEKIKREEERLRFGARSNLVEQNVRLIVSNVGKDLSNSVDSLVEKGIRYGNDSLNSELQDIIHSSLVANVKQSVRSISEQIASNFSVELGNLNSDLSAYCGESDFVQRLSEGAVALYENKAVMDDAAGQSVSESIGGAVYKTLTSVLAITTEILSPIVELLVIFLPGIIGNFFGKKKEEEQKEEARNKLRNDILTSIIPDIKAKLSSEIPQILEVNIDKMIGEISERYSIIIEEKQIEIAKAEAERQQKADEINEVIERLQSAKSAVEALSEKLK